MPRSSSPAPTRTLGRNVLALAAVSFLTDVSSEMIYPLLPVFLTVSLGASASALGAIEGAAESVASLLKLASGWWSDRMRRRTPLILAGYGMAAIARPLVALAQSATQVLAIRLTDRVGKGMRGAPRDALIADSVHPSDRGRAFGFQRAGDHAGAVIGALVAFALLQWWGFEMRTVFWLAAIPGVMAVAVVLLFVRESSSNARTALRAPRENGSGAPAALTNASLPRSYWGYLAIVLIFTLGNSTDAFLLLRAQQLGVPLPMLPIIWAMLHVVKSFASTPGGALSDRIGRAPAVIAGWSVYAVVYLGFAVASQPWHAWALVAVYGVFFALTEGPERALVADFAGERNRGTAFGWFHLVVGLGAFPASVLFGVVWDRLGPGAAFGMGAALAVTAAVGIAALPRPSRDSARRLP